MSNGRTRKNGAYEVKIRIWGSENMNKKKTVEYGKYGYMFIAPFFIVFLIFQLYPLIYTIYLSFVTYYFKGLDGVVKGGWNNFKNYGDVLFGTRSGVFLDTEVCVAIRNTIIMWVCNFIPQILLALVLAAWFTDNVVKLKGQGAYKVIMYMPNIITASTIAVLFYSLFSMNGPISGMMRDAGIISQEYNFMEHAGWSMGFIAFMQFWMWYGNTMIVLIAGILGINPSLYEAAMVDGASGTQQFFNITLPLLKPIIQFTLVTSAIGGLQMYDIPALFNVDQSYRGLPVVDNFGATDTITMIIRAYGITARNYGKAAAASMLLFAVTLVISILFFILTRDREPKQKHAVIR